MERVRTQGNLVLGLSEEAAAQRQPSRLGLVVVRVNNGVALDIRQNWGLSGLGLPRVSRLVEYIGFRGMADFAT